MYREPIIGYILALGIMQFCRSISLYLEYLTRHWLVICHYLGWGKVWGVCEMWFGHIVLSPCKGLYHGPRWGRQLLSLSLSPPLPSQTGSFSGRQTVLGVRETYFVFWEALVFFLCCLVLYTGPSVHHVLQCFGFPDWEVEVAGRGNCLPPTCMESRVN